MIDPQQALTRLQFGRVDSETDNLFEHCFIGTEMLRQVMLPQHALVVGNKGSGKSAICRLLCEDLQKVRPLLPKEFADIYCIPAYGLQSEDFSPNIGLRKSSPQTVDDFRYHWLLYLGLKTAFTLVQDASMRERLESRGSRNAKEIFGRLRKVLADVGLLEERGFFAKLRSSLGRGRGLKDADGGQVDLEKQLSTEFKQRTGISIIALFDMIDVVLQESNCLVWLMLDKLDLLFVDDIQKLRASIAGLVQLLVQYGNKLRHIHFKIFLRNDIYRQLHIVNKSHLVTYTTDMKWHGSLLMKLLVSRAVADPHVQKYCQEKIGAPIDVTDVIVGTDDYVDRIFNTIFDPIMNHAGVAEEGTQQWILKRLTDGTGNSFPRELIHLGNRAVEKQREINRREGKHTAGGLISVAALKEAFAIISAYRCDTYLYSEFPHLAKHFDVFRGSDTHVFHREQLLMLFEPLSPKGDEAIRAVYDAGLLTPMGNNVDSSRKFSIPLLYRKGLGITESRHRRNAQAAQRDQRIITFNAN